MLAFLVQVGGAPHASTRGMLAPLLFVIGGAVVGGVSLPLLHFAVVRSRTSWRGRRARRRRVAAAAGAERRARAIMSELCPFGWHAQISLFDALPGTVAAGGAPPEDLVALDWYELSAGGIEPAVMRRVWAGSVGEALEAMVADRRMDEALEQIEHRASADGALWPDR